MLGNYVYKHAAGYTGVGNDARLLEFDAKFFIASCTKLLTSIASLQLHNEDGTFELHRAKKSITLRHLLTHSAGATYIWADPTLFSWRLSRGEMPVIVKNGDVANAYAYPRAYEAGGSWGYSGGLDWASLLVTRLSKQGFEEYVEEIAKPLGITTFTWCLRRKPAVEEKLMNISTRQEDGTLIYGPTPFWPDPIYEGGGAGCYASVHDYTRVLSDLLKDDPITLRKETVDEIFSPQFKECSLELAGLQANAEVWLSTTYSGGVLVMEDVKRDNYFTPKGTMRWSGLPSLLWGVNREKGLAFMFATQVVPWADRKSFEVAARFETAVWRNLKP
ncbi:beta-lactamase/transpeptidase-like protein [Ophiobolus disseminans]|uniref:Beta-lactamase/transpeptidase-like protein n=1 Tax=Ophiobolus disseminans TaxID=1469910 RepID=A0A6A6ZJI0_9PLEO|nr:beta-lactamase/transpeptidase-like protein [Ophiobolus disseminans]